MAADRGKRDKKPAQSSAERQRGLSRLLGSVVALLLLAVIGVMILSQFFDTPLLKAPREAVARVITPIQNAFAAGTDFIADYLRTLKRRSNLEYEYNLLREKVDELTDQAMLANALQQQLQAYADLDDELARNTNLNGLKANIIGRDTSNYTFTLTLDAGKKHGVEDNMAVVVPGALVGITYDTMQDSTKVKAIVDTSCSVAAVIQSNRDPGTVSGTLAIDGEKNCRMYYLSYTTLPRPGDLVVTSGMGLQLPKGIPIGKVRESTRGMEDSKQYIVLEPIADFDHIEYVIIYRYRPNYTQQRQTLDALAPTFVPLPSIRPVPTLIGQPEPAASPGASASPGPTPSSSLSPTPAPSNALGRTPSPIPEDGFEYNAPPIINATPTVEPSPPPITPTPAPTFSPEELTVEDDEG